MRFRSRSLVLVLVVSLAACASGTAETSTTATVPGVETTSSPASTSATASSSRSSDRLTGYLAGESGAPLGYYEYLPPEYGDGDPRPLLLALHGFEGNGDGSREQLDNLFETGIPLLIQSDLWPEERPFVVLMPQHLFPTVDGHWCDGVEAHIGTCVMLAQSENGHPADSSPCMTPNDINAFLSYALGSYDVDVDRVYLTGLSCGGYSIYEYLAQSGGAIVAAVVPIAAEARPAWDAVGCSLGETAIWAFIGDVDDVVEPQGTIEPITALKDCTDPAPTDVELTVYSGVDHASWIATYDLSAGDDIYTWLLQHERSE